MVKNKSKLEPLSKFKCIKCLKIVSKTAIYCPICEKLCCEKCQSLTKQPPCACDQFIPIPILDNDELIEEF